MSTPDFLADLSIVPTNFYERSTLLVAKELLGKYLILTEPTSKIGKIIETEAYPGVGDRASHSSKGLTPRTNTLFGSSGRAYIYLIYGMYHCFNAVSDTPESGGAVLIRAVTPIVGLEGKTSGPGLVCKAYGITKAYNGHDLTQEPLTIQENSNEPQPMFTESTRIGIDYAGVDKERLYRFRIARL